MSTRPQSCKAARPKLISALSTIVYDRSCRVMMTYNKYLMNKKFKKLKFKFIWNIKQKLKHNGEVHKEGRQWCGILFLNCMQKAMRSVHPRWGVGLKTQTYTTSSLCSRAKHCNEQTDKAFLEGFNLFTLTSIKCLIEVDRNVRLLFTLSIQQVKKERKEIEMLCKNTTKSYNIEQKSPAGFWASYAKILQHIYIVTTYSRIKKTV